MLNGGSQHDNIKPYVVPPLRCQNIRFLEGIRITVPELSSNTGPTWSIAVGYG